MSFTQFKSDLIEQIGSDGLSTVLDILFERVNEEASCYIEVCTNKARLTSIEKALIGGTIDFQEHTTQRNLIRLAVLTLVQALQEKDLKPGKSPLLEAIAALNIDNVPKVALVNIDRSAPLTAFESGFEATSELPYQFYFIVGCPEQQPHYFAERTVYEIIAQVLINDEKAIHYKREPFKIGEEIVERVCIEPLPFSGFGLESCKNLLKTKLQERIAHLQLTFNSIEEFAALPDSRLPYRYFTLVFSIDLDGAMGGKWHKNLSPYLQWLIETFRANHTTLPTFQFIFVIQKRDIHRVPDPALEQALTELLVRFDPAPGLADAPPNPCVRIDGFVPVKKDDLKSWLSTLAKQRQQFLVEAVLEEYGQKLRAENRWDGAGDLDMADLEELILEVYKSTHG